MREDTSNARLNIKCNQLGGNSNIFSNFHPLKLGEDEPNLKYSNIFQMGWLKLNHQPVGWNSTANQDVLFSC